MVAERRRAARTAVRARPAGRAPEPAARAAPPGIPVLRDLDRLIHERVRLGIVSALAANETLSFADLKALLGVTDGNLSIHARKLEKAGYVTCTKRFERRVPRSEYRLTRSGREALARYLAHLDALVRWARPQA